MTEDVNKGRNVDESFESIEGEIRNPFQNFRFSSYLYEEFTQGSTIDQSQSSQKYDVRRNRVNAFLTIPIRLECFMFYGSLQSLDHFLYVYTMLPLRCLFALISLTFNIPKKIFGCYKSPLLDASQRCELLKCTLVVFCTLCISYFDSSVVYHQIRGQSVIKLYIFFNMLEVADRLLSAVSQDALDVLSWTAANPQKTSREHFSLLYYFVGAMVCLLLHSVLLLFQVTTLNVAFNSHNKALLTIMMSNNFVELKGSVFKKFAKNNLFQMSCSDVRERFHYVVMLSIVIFRNMSDNGWNVEDFYSLVTDVSIVLIAEVLVDWVKHAFITKFNAIPTDVYKEYTVSIAYDLLLSRQNKMYWDHFDLISRRTGLTPLPLSCLVNVILLQTFNYPDLYIYIPFVLVGLFLLKILLNLLLLWWAYTAVHAYEAALLSASLLTGGVPGSKAGATANAGASAGGVALDDLVLPTLRHHRRTRSESNLLLTSQQQQLPNGDGGGGFPPEPVLPSTLGAAGAGTSEDMTNSPDSLASLVGNTSIASSHVDELSPLFPFAVNTGGPSRIERSRSFDACVDSLHLTPPPAAVPPSSQALAQLPPPLFKSISPASSMTSTNGADSGNGNGGSGDLVASGTSTNPELHVRLRTKSRSEMSDGAMSGTSEVVKQPLPDVDRYSMYSSQIV